MTSTAAALYAVGSWLQGKSAKPKRPDDPIAGVLYDMQKYVGLSMAQHCIRYQILKDDATDYHRPYPSREEYDAEKQLPPAYIAGEPINPEEISYICQAVGHNELEIVKLMQSDQKLVINYLRLKYWDVWTQSQINQQARG
ncbi:MAG: hypothetical protein ACYCOR_16060 [Acidobacteriaceae bacterium]